MTRKLGAVGILAMVIALAIVLSLAAKSWSTFVTPTATELKGMRGVVEADLETPTDRREAAPPDAVRRTRGDLPTMTEMKQATDTHAADVQEALESID